MASKSPPRRRSVARRVSVAPNTRDCAVFIPGHVGRAAANGEVSEVMLFINDLSAYDKTHMRDAEGRSLVHLAAMCPVFDFLQDLVGEKRNLPVNAVDFRGRTPLHLACASGYLDHVRLLLNKGLSPVSLDGDGNTPISVALENNYAVIAATLREKIPPTAPADTSVESLRSIWPQSNRLISSDADLQLCWKEVEAIANFQTSVPLHALPWLDVPASTPQAHFAVVAHPPKLIAAMLLIEDEYQFEGLYFRVALEMESPHQTGTQVTIYESLQQPLCFVEFYSANVPHQHGVLRFYTSASGQTLDFVPQSPEVREPYGNEEAYFTHCGPEVRQLLLGRSVSDLGDATSTIIGVYRWWFQTEKFRSVMMRLVSAVARVKRFLKRNRLAKVLATAALTYRMAAFERYCRGELSRIQSAIFPAVSKVIRVTPQKRELIVRTALKIARDAFVAQVHQGTAIGRFTYAIPLPRVCATWAELINVDDVSVVLQKRGSFLPRASIMALQRKSSAISTESIARRRVLVMLLELHNCWVAKRSYASDIIDQINDERMRQDYQMEQQLARIREERRNAAMTARFISRLAEQGTRRQRVRGGRRGEDGADGGGVSGEYAPPGSAPKSPPTLVSFTDVVAPPLAIQPPQASDNTATADSDSQTTSPQLAQFSRQGSYLPVPPAGPARKDRDIKHVGPMVQLVFTPASCVPTVVGPKRHLRQLLVRVDDHGNEVTGDEAASMYISANVQRSLRDSNDTVRPGDVRRPTQRADDGEPSSFDDFASL